jgi:predicted DNA-binding transcriptional regulator AlpA
MKLKSKIPYHLREIVLTMKEAIITSGMGRATFFRYWKEESFTIPCHKAYITMWIKRLGFPRPPLPYRRDIGPAVKRVKRLYSEGMRAQEIADRLGLHFTTIHRYLTRSEDATSRDTKVS